MAENAAGAAERGRKAVKLKRANIFTKIVVLALIVYATVLLVNTNRRVEAAQQEHAQLQAEVNRTLQENAELEYEIAHANDPEIIAGIARSKLGLVKPGERIFYDVSN